jgi:ABC-type Fe2+-enterobactin transport system substrate-binding protein
VDEDRSGVETHPLTPHVVVAPNAIFTGELKAIMAPRIASESIIANMI